MGRKHNQRKGDIVAPSGHIFFQDEYESTYEVEWATVGDVIDMTSTIKQPGVWGKPPEGYIQNGVLFRKGIVTIERQVLRSFTGGYEIVADGSSQYEDFVQMNFPCQAGPRDTFKYHLNNGIVDECEGLVSVGSRWADVDNPDDVVAVWGDIDSLGDPLTVDADILAFIDVWS